jgi:hypothetical protein
MPGAPGRFLPRERGRDRIIELPLKSHVAPAARAVKEVRLKRDRGEETELPIEEVPDLARDPRAPSPFADRSARP